MKRFSVQVQARLWLLVKQWKTWRKLLGKCIFLSCISLIWWPRMTVRRSGQRSPWVKRFPTSPEIKLDHSDRPDPLLSVWPENDSAALYERFDLWPAGRSSSWKRFLMRLFSGYENNSFPGIDPTPRFTCSESEPRSDSRQSNTVNVSSYRPVRPVRPVRFTESTLETIK